MHDVKCALRFVLAHADELGIDPDRIVLWGTSAGGGINNAVAATLTGSRLDDLSLGHPDVQPRVRALVNWFAVADWVSCAFQHNMPTEKTFLVTSPTAADAQQYAAQGWKRVEDAELGFAIEDDLPRAFAASPIRMAQNEFLPALFQHGTADVIVPFADTVRMAQTVNSRVRPGLASVWPLRGEIHGGPRFCLAPRICNVAGAISHIFGYGRCQASLPAAPPPCRINRCRDRGGRLCGW